MTTKHTSTCLAKAGDDEPIFVLRAQDILAPMVIDYWADCLERERGPSDPKVIAARETAQEMRAYPGRKIPD